MKDDFTRRCEALDIIALALDGMRDITEETITASGLPTAQEREAVRCASREARLAREAIRATIDEVNRACERLDADIRAAGGKGLAFTTTMDEPGTTLCEVPSGKGPMNECRIRTAGENLAEVLVDMAREGR